MQPSEAITPAQGLSHYLEHMLFMGSEHFPDENEYDAFLSSHGGSANAYTEMVSTRTTQWTQWADTGSLECILGCRS